MKYRFQIGAAFMAISGLGHAFTENHCDKELERSVMSLNQAGAFSDSMKYKDPEDLYELKFESFCTISIPAMSDGIRYTIRSFKDRNAFLVEKWNGLTGNISTYGPFESEAYNKRL